MAARDFTAARRRLTTLRLTALGIARPSTDDPAEVVGGLLAIQAQDYPGALWSLGLRTPSGTRSSIEAVHQAGGFVRSWTMRGTLHFVRPDDLPWMLELTGRRMARSAAGRHRQLELDEQQFERAERIARERLADGATLSRSGMLEAFAEGGVPTTGQRGAHLLVQLAHTAVTVLVGQSEYALLEHRVPTPRVLEPAEALREFALRYFLSHGPATVQDFAWWSSLTLTDARAGLAAAREQLDELELGGARYYLRPDLQPADRGVHLLPGFDEYLLGYSDRRAPLSGAGTEVIVPGGNGMFLSTIVVNGEVVGSWRRTAKAKAVELSTAPFDRLSATTRTAIGRAAARYGRYLELPVHVDAVHVDAARIDASDVEAG
jgi:hypothetical protein